MHLIARRGKRSHRWREAKVWLGGDDWRNGDDQTHHLLRYNLVASDLSKRTMMIQGEEIDVYFEMTAQVGYRVHRGIPNTLSRATEAQHPPNNT